MKLSLDRQGFLKAASAMGRVITAERFPTSYNCLRVLAYARAGLVSLVTENFSWRARWRLTGARVLRPVGATDLLIRRADCLALERALTEAPHGTFGLDLDEAKATWETADLAHERSFEAARSLFLPIGDQAFAASRGGPVNVRLPASSLARVMELFDAARPRECAGTPLTFRFAGGAHEPVRVTCPYAPELLVLMSPARPINVEAGVAAAAS